MCGMCVGVWGWGRIGARFEELQEVEWIDGSARIKVSVKQGRHVVFLKGNEESRVMICTRTRTSTRHRQDAGK